MIRARGKRGICVALGASMAIAFCMATVAENAWAQGQAKVESSSSATAGAEALSQAFRTIAKNAKPAVVSITVRTVETKTRTQMKGQDGREIDPEDLPEPLRDFFREFKDSHPWARPEKPTPRMGMGSGVVIDAKNGYIITNNHVVEGAKGEKSRIDVRFADGAGVTAKIIGRDAPTDLALIQVKTDGLTLKELPIGDSDQIEVGDLVLAIGAPFGLTQTVTQGIVSATGRNPRIVQGYEDFIQTDAAINPGNSGGPLLNMQGQVVGINTAIVTSGLAAGYVGVGFAVPSSTVSELLAMWKEGKEIVRGYLGVEIQGLKDGFEPGIGQSYGLDEDKGILVQNVKPGTPAAKAGLKPDDIILAYDGKEVTTVPELQHWVARTKIDTKVDLKVWRDRKEITIPVTIEKQPVDYFRDTEWARRGGGGEDSAESAEASIEALGMTVATLTPALAKQFGWDEEQDLEGASLIVTEVEPLGEAAAGLGIHRGDLIVSVQGRNVKSPDALVQALSDEALSEGVRLRIRDVESKRTRTLFARTPK